MTLRIVDKDECSASLKAVLFPEGCLYKSISHQEMIDTIGVYVSTHTANHTSLIDEAETVIGHRSSSWLADEIGYTPPSIAISGTGLTRTITLTSVNGGSWLYTGGDGNSTVAYDIATADLLAELALNADNDLDSVTGTPGEEYVLTYLVDPGSPTVEDISLV